MTADRPRWPTPEELVPAPAPQQILLDVTNRCPLSCKRCPQPILRVQPEYRPGDMSLELFQKLADQTPQNTILTITGDGEPLVVRDLPEMVKYATDKGIVVRVITSGLIMSERTMTELLRANIDFLDFSLDAATAETYDQVRMGSNFEKVVGHVTRFLELRQQIQGEDPNTKVLVNMIDQPETHTEILQFFDMWEDKVDRVYVRPLHSVAGFVPLTNSPETGNSPDRIPCRVLYDRLVVDHKGNVFFCPLGWGRKEAMVGNITTQTVSEIWQGETLNSIRQSHIEHAINKSVLCHDCPDWKSFHWDQASGKYLNQLLQKD
ncbi:MAG: radical SAM/SPASM domain-containing protein [Patescibacteria group bacterium]